MNDNRKFFTYPKTTGHHAQSRCVENTIVVEQSRFHLT